MKDNQNIFYEYNKQIKETSEEVRSLESLNQVFVSCTSVIEKSPVQKNFASIVKQKEFSENLKKNLKSFSSFVENQKKEFSEQQSQKEGPVKQEKLESVEIIINQVLSQIEKF